MRKSFFLGLVLAVGLFNSCSRNPVTGKRQVVFMSEAQELAMGKEADPQIIASFGLYEDSSLQRFIREKGNQMAAISHRSNIDYHFRVVDSDVINAFAVPGGYVYFTRGIMAHFNDEAQFAGVLGHEIGHITARHSVAQQRNQILGQVGILAGVLINPELGRFAETASQGLGLLFLKFGRDAERESDRLGVEYSSKIGYDAAQMASFFTTLERKGAESGAAELPDFLSTHPNPGDRNITVSKLAAEWKQKLNLTNAQINRNSYLKRIEGLIYGEDPKQGFKENNMFYHPALRFQFPIPQDWNYQNAPDRVQMAPKDGKALMLFTIAPGKSLQEAANAVLQQNNLQLLRSDNVTVNGHNAIAMIADSKQDPQQQQAAPVRTLSYVIQHGETIYLILGATNTANYATYSGYFLNTMQGFRTLTDASIINRKPERIAIKTINSNITLEQALRNYKVAPARLDEHAILNGMKLTDPVTPGTMIKVVERS